MIVKSNGLRFSVEDVGDEITLMSFEGLTLYPRVQRLPGMEGVDVLEDTSVGQKEDVIDMIKSK